MTHQCHHIAKLKQQHGGALHKPTLKHPAKPRSFLNSNSTAFLHYFVHMRLLSALLLSPLFAAVIASIAVGTMPYQLRHSLRCKLPLRTPPSPLQPPNSPPPPPISQMLSAVFRSRASASRHACFRARAAVCSACVGRQRVRALVPACHRLGGGTQAFVQRVRFAPSSR